MSAPAAALVAAEEPRYDGTEAISPWHPARASGLPHNRAATHIGVTTPLELHS